MSLQLNDKAPDFKLFNTTKQEVKLSDFQGRNVVLLFFPFAFTSTCTAELCNIRDSYTLYNDFNAVVFGISVDSLYALARFKEEQKLNFELLSDFNKEVSAAYSVLYAEFNFGMKGVSKRSVFILNKEGVLKYTEVLETASHQPDYEAMKASLAKLG